MDTGSAKCLDDTELVGFSVLSFAFDSYSSCWRNSDQDYIQNNPVQPVHFREPLHHALKTDMGRPDWTGPPYDLVTTYWLRSLDDMLALAMDSEWAELEKEAQARSNMSIGQFVVGHEVVHFDNNKEAGS